MFAACGRDPACTAAHGALRGQWQGLLTGLPREVAAVHPFSGHEERFTLTREMLLSWVRGPLYMPGLAAGLPNAIHQAAQGRWAPMLGLASSMSPAPNSPARLAMGMHFSVVCAEDVPRWAASRDAPGADFGASLGDVYRRVCADWPQGEVPEAFYRMGPATAPFLVLSGGADPVTPPRHGARVAQALGGTAKHVVVQQAGHGVMALPCMRDVLYRFIDAVTDADAAAVDAGCAAGIPRPPAFRPVLPGPVPAPALVAPSAAASAAALPTAVPSPVSKGRP
jgi:hypothetical protein